MRITLHKLHKMRHDGHKIAVLTAYDASFTALVEAAGVEVILIGDSLGMVVQGHETTLAVSLDQMVYHTECVVRASRKAFVIADMPFGTYQESPSQAFLNGARLMAAGAHMIKVEGGEPMLDTTRFLTRRGVPVCGHIGLTPQAVHQLGGYRVQGRAEDDAARLLADAVALEQAGASLLVLEAVPSKLAREVTEALSIPTIGIGAGPDCSGQVLVLYDMLGVYPGKKARFVKDYMEAVGGTVQAAVEAYVREVKSGEFPAPEHCF